MREQIFYLQYYNLNVKRIRRKDICYSIMFAFNFMHLIKRGLNIDYV